METYHPASGSPLDVPAIELDYNQFELDESGSGQEAEAGPEEESSEPNVGARAVEPTNQSGTDVARMSRVWNGSIPSQPGLRVRETEVEIHDVGLFRRGSGQPIQLRAYPYVRPKSAPPSSKRPQPYREQGHCNPVWTYVRGTRRDRLQALVKAWREAGSPTEDDQPASAFEIRLYAGEKWILQEPQLWIGDVGPEADYNRLEECDCFVMNAIRESGRLPRLEGGFNVMTPSYLTVVLPRVKAMLTAREAIELGVVFLYDHGRR